MKPEELIGLVKSQVRDAAVDAVMRQLESPTGRRPHEGLKRLSEWFVGLDASSQERVKEVARLASQFALHGFFSVVDGVRAIRDPAFHDEFELIHKRGNEVTRFGGRGVEYLHDLMNIDYPGDVFSQ